MQSVEVTFHIRGVESKQTFNVADGADIDAFKREAVTYLENSSKPEYKNISFNVNSVTGETKGWKYSRSVNTEKQHASLSITDNTLDGIMAKSKEFREIFDDIDSKSQRVEFLMWYKAHRRDIKSGKLSIRSFIKKQSVLLAKGHNVILTYATKEQAAEAALKVYGILGTLPTIIES